MSYGRTQFVPCPPLVSGPAHHHCRACITIPARNEELGLVRTLDALAQQVDLSGNPLHPDAFEVLLLLNNCTDASLKVAKAWQDQHPEVHLYIVERMLRPEEAHVGTARRLLMDTAWARLQTSHASPVAILCTDADTVVAPDWIAQNLHALETGADAVGGRVELLPEDFQALPPFVQRCYEQDRHYACLVAQLEDALDPRPGDACPRHLDHFGASLACTREAYELAGGMPAVTPLEDEAFIDRIRRANLRLRHTPAVRVYTSARLEGRAVMGLAGQLRVWQDLAHHRAHCVPSAAFLEHRFRMMSRLRKIFGQRHLGDLNLPTEWWRTTFAEALREEETCPGFLGAVYCDILIEEAFDGPKEEPIELALYDLQERIRQLRLLPSVAQTSA